MICCVVWGCSGDGVSIVMNGANGPCMVMSMMSGVCASLYMVNDPCCGWPGV